MGQMQDTASMGAKIPDKVAALGKNEQFYSFEYFPPKTDMGWDNLQSRIERMSSGLLPLFTTVTWGTGGSTAQKSLDLAVSCEQDHGVTSCLHLTCTNMARNVLDDTLAKAKAAGIRNILALRGDPPRGEEYSTPSSDSEFQYAIDLIRYIKNAYGDYFAIGAAAYPEGHVDNSDYEVQDRDRDIEFLVEKVRAGATFIITQIFFDVQVFLSFERKLREHPSGVFRDILLIPCIMPIQSYATLKRLSKLSHATVPPAVLEVLDPLRGDDDKVKSAGVQIASEMIKTIVSDTDGRIRGFHFCTLNLEKCVSFILEQTGLLASAYARAQMEKEDVAVGGEFLTSNGNGRMNGAAKHRKSSGFLDPNNKIVVDSLQQKLRTDLQLVDSEAGMPISEELTPNSVRLAVSEGEGTLGRQATWDEFPNGRFTDPRSPAYGEIDGYGPTLQLPPKQALEVWGYPVTEDDITQLFLRYLNSEISAIPWSSEGLSDETNLISDALKTLNKRQWWTICSQPSIDGIKSDDPVVGWGPGNGWVFQKAFVELFVDQDQVEDLIAKVSREPSISYYAANAFHGYKSNMTSDDHNAVTWGVFPGKEIVTPTIIETASFMAWKDEAFDIWRQWSLLYPKSTASHSLLDKLWRRRWLVTLVDHEFHGPGRLWATLDCV